MKKIFLSLAILVIACCANAQTNQYFWHQGKLMLGAPIAQTDSVTFGAEDTDSILIYLPRTIIKEVHDTVYIIVHDTVCPEEPIGTTLWEGPQYLQWDADRVRVDSSVMAQVPTGATIYIYYEILPSGHEGYLVEGTYEEYNVMRVTTPWWEEDLVSQIDVFAGSTPNPITFTYDARCKALVENAGAMSLVGWGLQINRITYK